ncbi:hypothetical protein H311_02040 [Anncaliia algerae PRA109]|nr:hypothetical protein H311_02040 [Anncaliia algerae PRA109]
MEVQVDEAEICKGLIIKNPCKILENKKNPVMVGVVNK